MSSLVVIPETRYNRWYTFHTHRASGIEHTILKEVEDEAWDKYIEDNQENQVKEEIDPVERKM